MVVCGSLVQLALQEELVAVMARQSAEQPPVANLVLIKLMPALPWETFVKQHVNLSPGLSNSSSTFKFIQVIIIPSLITAVEHTQSLWTNPNWTTLIWTESSITRVTETFR